MRATGPAAHRPTATATRMALTLGIGALVVAGAGVLPAHAAGGTITMLASGSWWRAQPDGGQLPPPPNVPTKGLWVQSNPGGPSAVSAVRFRLAGAAAPVLHLRVHEATPAAQVAIAACPTTSAWKPATAGPWSARPKADCSVAQAAGVLSPDTTRLTVDLSGIPAAPDGTVDVVLQPASAATPPTFDATFEAVQASDVATTVANPSNPAASSTPAAASGSSSSPSGSSPDTGAGAGSGSGTGAGSNTGSGSGSGAGSGSGSGVGSGSGGGAPAPQPAGRAPEPASASVALAPALPSSVTAPPESPSATSASTGGAGGTAATTAPGPGQVGLAAPGATRRVSSSTTADRLSRRLRYLLAILVVDLALWSYIRGPLGSPTARTPLTLYDDPTKKAPAVSARRERAPALR